VIKKHSEFFKEITTSIAEGITGITLEQARKKAKWLIALNQGSAALEGQGIDSEALKKIEDDLTDRIFVGELEVDNEGID